MKARTRSAHSFLPPARLRQQSRLGSIAVILGACWLVWSMPGCAQTPQVGGTVYHLHGTVLNGSTGQPLARVLVTTEDRFVAAFTDANGHFSLDVNFAAVPASASATLRLTATKPYYLAVEDTLDVALDDKVASRDLVFRLTPDAIITGRVTTPASDGAADVRVDLLKHEVRDGRRQWTTVNVHSTDSHGTYRFYGVEPGEYTVMTSAWAEGGFPYSSMRSVPSFTSFGSHVMTVQGTIPASSGPQDRKVDDTPLYPPSYLGDARTVNAATLLHPQAAEQVQADVHLEAVPFFPVVIPVAVPPAPADPNGPTYEVSASLLSTDGFGARPLHYDADAGVMQGWLPSGTYEILLTAGGPSAAYATLSLHVGSAPVRTAPVTLAPAVPIPIHVRREFTAASSQAAESPVSVQFRPEIDGQPERGGATSTKAEFDAENVAPGRYQVVANAANGYVASITSRGSNLMRESLVVGNGGSDPIEVTLRDDWGSLTGTVAKTETDLPPGLFVAAIATDIVDAQAIRVQRMDADGSFRFAELPPGTYHVFACRKVPWNFPFRDSDAMQVLSSKMALVQIKTGETGEVTAPLLPAAGWETR